MRRPPLQQFETARIRMLDQLTQHLVDLSDLHRQVVQARSVCGQHDGGAGLFDELAETLDQHRTLIAEQVRGLTDSEISVNRDRVLCRAE